VATKFSAIYERAVFKFSDYSFIDFESELKETVLRQHLMSAVVDFQHSCKADLTKYGIYHEPGPEPGEPEASGRARRRRRRRSPAVVDEPDGEGEEGGEPEESETGEDKPEYAFEEDLDGEMVEILALGIVYYWLSAKALNSDMLRNVMHNKDYTSYSPANLLKEIKELRIALKREYEGRIRTYSFRNGDIDKLRAGG